MTTATAEEIDVRQNTRPGRPMVNGIQWWVPFVFLAPALVCTATFLIVPLVGGLLVAFTSWDVISGLGGIRWVGLGNFIELFGDPRFWASTGRTVFYAGISVPLTIALGMVLAMALNRPLPGRAALRVIFFSPTVVNIIAVGSVWLLLLNPQSGLINQGLRAIGVAKPPGWITDPDSALSALVIMAVWAGSGYISVIFLAAMQDMPQDLYEAATLDGAGRWRRFTTVTWPALMPTTIFLTITQFIGRSQTFGAIVFMTSGGPGEATTVLSYYMYQNGFMYYRFGYAAAMGVVSLITVLGLTVALWRYQRSHTMYEEG